MELWTSRGVSLVHPAVNLRDLFSERAFVKSRIGAKKGVILPFSSKEEVPPPPLCSGSGMEICACAAGPGSGGGGRLGYLAWWKPEQKPFPGRASLAKRLDFFFLKYLIFKKYIFY